MRQHRAVQFSLESVQYCLETAAICQKEDNINMELREVDCNGGSFKLASRDETQWRTGIGGFKLSVSDFQKLIGFEPRNSLLL